MIKYVIYFGIMVLGWAFLFWGTEKVSLKEWIRIYIGGVLLMLSQVIKGWL